MKLVIKEILAIRQLPIPDDMIYEIISFLYREISHVTKRLKYQLLPSINTDLIRYEEFDLHHKLCIWGIGLTYNLRLNIINHTCTTCGNFITIESDQNNRRTQISRRNYSECTCFIKRIHNV